MATKTITNITPDSAFDDDDFDELSFAIAAVTGEDNLNTSNKSNATAVVRPILKEDDSFAEAFASTSEISNVPIITSITELNSLPVREKEFDSSDDEDVKNFLEQKYNQYGRDLNKKIKINNAEKREAQVTKEVDNSIQNSPNLFGKNKPRVSAVNNNTKDNNESRPPLSGSFKPLKISTQQSQISPNAQISSWLKKSENNVYKDPIFGMRLINPLISSSILVERMEGRKAISMSSIQFHIERGDLTQDWVVAGAVLSKSPVKTAKNGSSYSIWKLSDLKGDIKTISLFLFKSAHGDLWKTSIGMVIAILNPRAFDKREERNDVASISIDTAQQVMLLGHSKDMGTCKAKKKNGENCTAIVNLGECDFCIYHVKQEFGKMSKRSELQSSTAGRGLQELRNKILGKSEVFYGGQSFVAIPAKKSAKLAAKDNNRMLSLSEYYQSPNAATTNHISKPRSMTSEIPYAERAGLKSKVAGNIEVNTKQRLKDLERLKLLKEDEEKRRRLSITDKEVESPPTSHKNTTSPSLLSSPQFGLLSNKNPTLSKENFTLDLNVGSKQAKAAKLKAIQVLKIKPIEKSNPNFIKYRGTIQGKKRVIDDINDFHNNTDAKRIKLEEDKTNERKSRIQKIMAATSSHANLVEIRENEEQEIYFNKLEKKEAMEEKMLNTFKLDCKAVICLKCKYTAFSAGDRCKEEKHPLKVIDAVKRFFQCSDCGNRTVSLDKMPKQSCKNCQSSRWQRSAMIKEKKLIDPSAGLSIRGDEEKFVGSLSSSANLNLLVPDEE